MDDVQKIISGLMPLDPQKVILFGSRAAGNNLPDSDIDIAIIKNTSLSFHDRLIEARRLIRTTIPVDIFVFTEDEIQNYQDHNPLIHEIVTKGRVMYGSA